MVIYSDLSGREIERPVAIPVAWRVSCYPIVLRDNHILMVEPVWATRWELPGGDVELAHEGTLVEAAIRECMEETGYHFVPEPESLSLIQDDFFSVAAEDHYYHSLMFSVTGTVETERAENWTPLANEIVKTAWLPLSALSSKTVHGPHWRALVNRGLVDTK